MTHSTHSMPAAKSFIAALPLAFAALTGCGVGPAATSPSGPLQPAIVKGISGETFGGQQPISGSTIQLYAVNTSTLKGASTALIAATVLTDSNGFFNISNAYSCPAGAQVYITATGGNAGGGTNSAIALLAALGPCSGLTGSTYIYINEQTTVAGVYALAPFMADIAHIGAPSNLSQGLTNAFQTGLILANTANGSVPGPNASAGLTVPNLKVSALANSIAACINSINGGTQCTTLFNNAKPSTGSAPTDTVGALLDIVQNPQHNVAPIYNLAATQPPFAPALTSAPADWTMPIIVSGGGLAGPYGLAVDASGNVWTANSQGFSVSKFNYLGVDQTGGSGYTAAGSLLLPQALAIDLTGNVWVANTGGSSIVKMSASGTPVTGSPFTNGIGAAYDINVDFTGNAWVANFDMDSITELNAAGTPINGSPIAEASGSAPVSVALDPSGNVWISNSGTGNVAKFSGSGSPASGSPYTDGFLTSPLQLALSSTGSAWIVNPGSNSLSSLLSTGAGQSFTPLTSNAMSSPSGLAIDGSSTVWVSSNATNGSLAAFTSAGTSLTPIYGLGTLNAPIGVAVDMSGNVWTADSGDNTLTEFVGLASPVPTPLAARITPH